MVLLQLFLVTHSGISFNILFGVCYVKLGGMNLVALFAKYFTWFWKVDIGYSWNEVEFVIIVSTCYILIDVSSNFSCWSIFSSTEHDVGMRNIYSILQFYHLWSFLWHKFIFLQQWIISVRMVYSFSLLTKFKSYLLIYYYY